MTTSPKAGMPEEIFAWSCGEGDYGCGIRDRLLSDPDKYAPYVLASRLHAAEKVIEVAEMALRGDHVWNWFDPGEADPAMIEYERMKDESLSAITAYKAANNPDNHRKESKHGQKDRSSAKADQWGL